MGCEAADIMGLDSGLRTATGRRKQDALSYSLLCPANLTGWPEFT
jgi:hypothetical protein